MSPDEPLEYPSHYPPGERRKQFFLGVRWLGPDLSFFGELRKRQGARTEAVMAAWPSGNARSLARLAGALFQEHLRWPTPYFVPADRWQVLAGGPKFDVLENDLDMVVHGIEQEVGRELGADFWLSFSRDTTFGEVVTAILAESSAA